MAVVLRGEEVVELFGDDVDCCCVGGMALGVVTAAGWSTNCVGTAVEVSSVSWVAGLVC